MSVENKVEAILFASGKSMDVAHIAQLVGLKPAQTKKALASLRDIYEQRGGALFIFNENDRWKINVKEEFIPLVKSLVAETELARAVLETLSVIAYRSPVLQSDVIKSRGAGAYDHIAELVERGFVTKEKHARSYKLNVTEKFYNYFDVEGHEDIKEVFKNIKQPDPAQLVKVDKAQTKLGDLDVVEAESDEEHERKRQELKQKIVEIEEKREQDKEYLEEFEGRLETVKQRLNTTEDELSSLTQNRLQSNDENNQEVTQQDENQTNQVSEQINQEGEDLTNESIEQETSQEDQDILADDIPDEENSDIEPQELVEKINKEIEELTKEE